MRPVRHLYPMLCAMLLLAPVSTALASNTQAATQPTTQPLDFSTPKAMLLSYDRCAGGGVTVFIQFYATHNAEEEKLVAAESRSESMYGLLQVIAQKKWGNDGMNTVLHALGEKTHDDIEAGTVELNGDTARFIWGDDSPSVPMVQQNGRWKVDATGFKNSLGISVEDYIDSLHDMSPLLTDIADGIDQGKLATPAATAAEIDRQLKAMNH